MNVIYGICKECISPLTFKILTWLGYSNSAFNPVIYSIFNADFRDAFRRILTMKQQGCSGCCCNGSDHNSGFIVNSFVANNRNLQRAQNLWNETVLVNVSGNKLRLRVSFELFLWTLPATAWPVHRTIFQDAIEGIWYLTIPISGKVFKMKA